MFNFKLDDVPIKVYDVKVEEPSYSFFDCMKYEVPYSYKVTYTIGLEDGRLKTTSVLEVPKMHQGSFLIHGTESVGGVAVRTPVNLLRIEKPIGVFTKQGKMTISSNNFSFKIERGSEPKAKIIIKEGLDRDSPVSTYFLGSYFRDNNLEYKLEEKDLELVCDDRILSEYPPIYVDKRFFDKMYYLFGYEIEYIHDKSLYLLTPKDVYNIWKLANTNFDRIDRVTPFDLNYGTPSASIMRHFRCNMRMRTQIFGKWVRNKKIDKIYTEPVQRYLDSYFRMQSESAKDLQVANDTNALDQLSQQRKCYLAKTDGTKVPISYDADFVGIIDPGKTHEGQGTSKRNEFARGIKTTPDGLLIRLIDAKTNKQVWVDLLTHYKSSILSTTSWDYDDDKLVVNKNGKIQIIQKGRYHYVNPDYKYDYRRVYRDDILGYGDSAIPMMNATDHTRVALGTSQLDQSIPTIGSTPPIVATGVEKDIYEISSLNIRSDVDGIVENVTQDYIKIRINKSEFKSYQIPSPISTRAHTNQFFFPTVKIGDKVKKGDIIVAINSFKDKQLAVSTPLMVAYTDYKLGTFEDSTILSESAAKKLGHKAVVTIDIPIVLSTEYVYGKEDLSFRNEYSALESSEFQYLNDLMLPNIGDKVEPGQMIFTYLYESDQDLEKVMRLRRLISPTTKIYQKMIKRVPRNVIGGVVRDVYVTIKSEEFKIAKDIRDYYKDFYDKKNENQYNDIKVVAPEINRARFLRNDQVAIISIDIEYINAMKVGDKASNRFGTKGLIKMILPDDQMPKLPTGQAIDMIVGAESVMSRKNIAQIYEIALGHASVELWKKSKDIIESDIPEDEKKNKLVKILNTLFVTDRFSKKSYNELLEEFNRFDGFYQISVPAIDNKYMNHKAMSSIMELAGLPQDGKHYLTIGKRKTTNPVVCGISSIERLHFIVELKSKSTSSTGGNKKNDLAIGRGGQIKSTGQRLGAQEIFALEAYGAMELLEHLKQEDANYGKKIEQELNALTFVLRPIDEV